MHWNRETNIETIRWVVEIPSTKDSTWWVDGIDLERATRIKSLESTGT